MGKQSNLLRYFVVNLKVKRYFTSYLKKVIRIHNSSYLLCITPTLFEHYEHRDMLKMFQTKKVIPIWNDMRVSKYSTNIPKYFLEKILL